MSDDLRRQLQRHRRREAQLTALFRTAGDLAAMRDLDQVLQAIVDRARVLLEADVSYLTLHSHPPPATTLNGAARPAQSPAADTYMRTTSGSISARFQQVRLPMGAGLGGLVAQTAAPYHTPDYRTDERFWHTHTIDGAVADEGLIGILGIPLKLGSTVLGVLFAADRKERHFGAEEVSLLASLADHAAIAIDNARRLQETQDALTELDTTTTLLRERTATLERAADAHDRLTDLVLGGASLTELTDAVTSVLGGELLVLDTAGRRVGGDGPPGGDASAMRSAEQHSRATHDGKRWIARIAAGNECLGALVLHPRTDHELDHAEQRILERAAMATAVLLLLRRSVADTEHRIRGDLLADLVSAPHRDPDRLTARAEAIGLYLARPHVLLVVDPAEHDAQRFGRSLARHAAGAGGLAGRHDGRPILLVPGEEAGSAARELAAELGATVGAAGPTAGLADIPAGHAEATRCLDALLALGSTGTGGCLRDLGFLGLVLGKDTDVPGFVRSVLGPILDYDERRGTDLLATLEAYFAADRSPARAHTALHVHVNTVTQRLDRIATLLGPDWQQPDRTLELQLALKLHRTTPTRP